MALILVFEATNTGVGFQTDGPTVVSEESLWKRAVRAASTANVVDPLTAAPATIDGVTLADDDRILLKDQSTASTNGIYRRVSASVWERASDYEVGALVEAGIKVYSQEGTANAKKTWRMITTGTITVGTDPTSWEEDGGGGGGGATWAATLALGNTSGGTDAVMSDGDALRGVDQAAGLKLDGTDLLLRWGEGSTAIEASGTLTVQTYPVTAGFTVGIGRPNPFPGIALLTAVNGTRTSGSNDFSGNAGSATLVAADIAAAINDGANAYVQFSAVHNGDNTVTVSWVNQSNPESRNGTSLDGIPSTEVTGTGFSGAINAGNDGAIKVDSGGDARGVHAIDLQSTRAASNQVASGDESIILGGFNNRNQWSQALAFGRDIDLQDIAGSGFTPGTLALGQENSISISGDFASSLLVGRNIYMDGYNSGASVAYSVVHGFSHSFRTNYYQYIRQSHFGGFNHYLDHGGVDSSLVQGDNHFIGAYIEASAVVGAYHDIGAAYYYYSMYNCLLSGENNTVVQTANLENSLVGGTNVKVEAPGGLNLTSLNVWGDGTHATIAQEVVWAAGSSARQASILQLQNSTTTATPAVLLTRVSVSGSFNRRYTIRLNQAHQFKGTVIAHEPATGDVKSWDIEGLIKNIAGTVTLVGSSVTVLHASAGAAAWTVALGVDTINDALRVTVTGEAGKGIQWNSFLWGPHAGNAT
jgi:hypothetical protein